MQDKLRKNKAKIARRWLDRTFETYSAEASKFLKRQKDPFANPVGEAFSKAVEPLVDAWLDDASRDEVMALLDRVVQIRTVQDKTPSGAVAFVLLLKDILREEVGRPDSAHAYDQLIELEARIDRFALWAFDCYAGHRERIYKIRVNEVRRRVSTLMKMFDVSIGYPEEEDSD